LKAILIANFITYIILGMFFFGGLANLTTPRFMWKITESWKATKEPGKLYFIGRRIIGFILICIPVAYLYLYIIWHIKTRF
jgi:hypothetical protein